MSDFNELICICMDVRRNEIEQAIISQGLTNIDEVGDATESGLNCGACHDELQKILDNLKGQY